VFVVCLLGTLACAAPAPAEIVWGTNGCPPAIDECSQVWRANDDGSGARKVLSNAWSPSFDATGARIAFIRGSGVHVANADGSDARPLAPPPVNQAFYDGSPVFSPDGTRVAFDSNRPTGGSCRRVWIVDAAGATEPQPLPGSVCGDRLPRFSPTGGHIIGLQYGEFGTGSPALVARPVTGGPSVEVVSNGTAIGPFGLAFSPDGRAVTFEGRYGLTTLDLTTGRRLVTAEGWEPAWSPVGPALYFSGRTPGDKRAIFRLAAGSGPVQVTPGTSFDTSPSWAPIGLDLPPFPVVDTIGPLVANLADRLPIGLPETAIPPRIAAGELDLVTPIDPSGVRTYEASAALESGKRCRFVAVRGPTRKRSACRPRAFYPVTTASLQDRFEDLPEGNYRVWLRATDGVGNRAPARLLRVAR
jgi:hypothetical protein